MDKKLEKISEMKDNLISCMDSVMSRGISEVDTKEAGEVIDMIKDLAEAEKACMEAKYYKSVIEAMDEYEPDNERMGYNNRRYSNGRYAPSGMGSVMGYHNMNAPYYIDKYMDDNRMGYTRTYEGSYKNYQDARKHYTTSKSSTDKEEMDKNAELTIKDIEHTLKDIWGSADISLKRRMKDDISNLLLEMNV